MLINQYKTNFNLEQQLKDLQSSKATTSQSPIPTLQSETFHYNPKRSAFDENQSKSSLSFCSSSSNSTGYSSGSSSIDSNSTILSAYSSRSNSSLSERSKTSPTSFKPISMQFIPLTMTDEEITPRQSPLPTTSEQYQNKFIQKRRRTINNEVLINLFFLKRIFI